MSEADRRISATALQLTPGGQDLVLSEANGTVTVLQSGDVIGFGMDPVTDLADALVAISDGAKISSAAWFAEGGGYFAHNLVKIGALAA